MSEAKEPDKNTFSEEDIKRRFKIRGINTTPSFFI